MSRVDVVMCVQVFRAAPLQSRVRQERAGLALAAPEGQQFNEFRVQQQHPANTAR